MIPEDEYKRIKKDIDKIHDSLIVKKARMEDLKQRIKELGVELVQKGVISSLELDNMDAIESRLKEYEEDFLKYYKELKALSS